MPGGWYYDVPSDPPILSCPATCEKIQADTTRTIAVELGCETQVIQPKQQRPPSPR